MLKEHRFDTGELELNYAKGPDGGPPLVLLHGLTARWHGFLPIMPHLLLGHTLYAVDLRGHGKSGRVPGRYRCLDYGEDMRAFIEGGVGEPATVLGLSLGGLVAAYLASQHPELVSALILEEPALWDTTHIQPWFDSFTQCYELTSLGKTAAELRDILQVENALGRKSASWLSQLDPGPVAAFFDKSLWQGFEAETMLVRITCPVLLIYGYPEKGSILTQEQVEYVLSAIPDCVSDFMDVGHVPHEQPVENAVILVNFLQTL